MKNLNLYLGCSIFLSLTILSGCQSSAEKVENTEDKAQEAEKDLADFKRDLYRIRLDTISSYEQFKVEAEKIIIAHEIIIYTEFRARKVKEKYEVKANYKKKLVRLENENNDLRRKLADFRVDDQDKWIGFKNEFNHDMNELGDAFNDLTGERESLSARWE